LNVGEEEAKNKTSHPKKTLLKDEDGAIIDHCQIKKQQNNESLSNTIDY
jgi:hypothetical protein